ncbi:AcrR family transcriptional regulator [Arthrobacter pigmenti]|uniref:AcrR family transcriptional regulator n=1 Tax=Arthrobacter pigmenti TaxID=271432 RepID=A0A846RNM2_9MICC|nr:TetR family transcriptional regulator [Arthrobacter pigmenti]NJC21737.1 AcrR family transcriptional regulator [Arthrobacter pigmenti]
MDNSADNDDGGLRERKRRATRSAICTTARRLTAERGLAGFTVEELCELVGVSRRTFFNYFPSKEDAILGHDEDAHFPEDLVTEFLDSAGRICLLDALTEYAANAGERLALTREQFAQLHAVMQKEPELLAKLFGESAVRQKEFAALIARREGMAADDPRASMATHILSHIAWTSTHTFLTSESPQSYREILITNIDAARYLFSEQSRPAATSEGKP